MAGALSLPKATQPATLERIICEVNRKARKMNEDGITDEEHQQRQHKYSFEDLLEAIPSPIETP